MSDVPVHETYERVRIAIRQTDAMKKEIEKSRMRIIVERFVVPIQYIRGSPEVKLELTDRSPSGIIEHYTIKEVKIGIEVQKIKQQVEAIIKQVADELIDNNRNIMINSSENTNIQH